MKKLIYTVSVYVKFVGRKLQVAYHRHVCSCSVTIFRVEASIVVMSPSNFHVPKSNTMSVIILKARPEKVFPRSQHGRFTFHKNTAVARVAYV
jgi:hypothetical protein